MEQLGYRPNRLAQNLSRRDTQMLAVMLPPLNHAFAGRNPSAGPFGPPKKSVTAIAHIVITFMNSAR